MKCFVYYIVSYFIDLCVHTYIFGNTKVNGERAWLKRGEASWEDGTQAQFTSLCLKPHHSTSSGTRFPLPPSLSFSTALGFYSEPENPSSLIAPERFRSKKTEASQARKSNIGEQSIEDNDSDSHFFQSHRKQYQDAILPGLAPLWQALCPQMHILCRNAVNAP